MNQLGLYRVVMVCLRGTFGSKTLTRFHSSLESIISLSICFAFRGGPSPTHSCPLQLMGCGCFKASEAPITQAEREAAEFDINRHALGPQIVEESYIRERALGMREERRREAQQQ